MKRVLKVILFLSYTGLIFYLGFWVSDSGYYEEHLKPTVKETALPLMNSVLNREGPEEQVHLTIETTAFNRLKAYREEGLNNQILTEEQKQYVDATVLVNGEEVKVKIRLKGNLTDHINSEKWSYRVKVAEDQVLGMTTFSLQHPYTRNHVYEWIFHQALKREGLVALDYRFVELFINNESFGVYAMEEHFNAQLLERYGQQPSPILRFDDQLRVSEMAQRKHIQPSFPENIGELGGYLSSEISAFSMGKVKKDSLLFHRFEKAFQQLELYRKGMLPAHKVFDVKALAQWYALTDLMGAQHSTAWRNQRFYYNPATKQLVPIGYDGDSGYPIEQIRAKREFIAPLQAEPNLANHYAVLFSDTAFYTTYLYYLEQYTAGSFLDDFLSDISEELNRNVEVITSEFPNFEYSRAVFDNNRKIIRSTLQPTQALHAYLVHQDETAITLKLGNIQELPIELLSIDCDSAIIAEPLQQHVLSSKQKEQPVNYQQVTFTRYAESGKQLYITYRMLGGIQTITTPIKPWQYTADE